MVDSGRLSNQEKYWPTADVPGFLATDPVCGPADIYSRGSIEWTGDFGERDKRSTCRNARLPRHRHRLSVHHSARDSGQHLVHSYWPFSRYH